MLTSVYRYASIRNGHATEDIRIAISTQQIEITEAIGTTKNRLQAVEDSMAKWEPDPSEQDQPSLEQEQKAFAASLQLLHELLAKLQAETVAKAAAQSQGSVGTTTFGGQNSGFQAGLINGGVSGISFGKQ